MLLHAAAEVHAAELTSCGVATAETALVVVGQMLLNKYAELATLVPVEKGAPIEVTSERTRGLYVVADGIVTATIMGHHHDASAEASTWQLSYGQVLSRD